MQKIIKNTEKLHFIILLFAYSNNFINFAPDLENNNNTT